MSAISWIVGTLREQDELLGLEDPFARADSRDVLGVGTLRDAIADAFFPGVTTQQTRAKYFLFIPAMYTKLEKERVRDTHGRMHQLEDELLKRLHAGAAKHGPDGIIGNKSWTVPLRPASEIYWSGLRTWRIRQFRNPRAEYHRMIELGLLSSTSRLSEDEPGSADVERWRLPDEVEALSTTDTLDLSKPEARFLRDRVLAIKDRPHTSILKYLVDAPGLDLPRSISDIELPASARLRPLLAHARRLATAVHGAMLLYNARCAELRGDAAVTNWSADFDRWRARHGPGVWREWDLGEFWACVEELERGPEARRVAYGFIDGLAGMLGRESEREQLLDYITDREALIKPGRARLLGHELLEDWNPQTGVGVGEMSYRWPAARTILTDIRTGLRRR